MTRRVVYGASLWAFIAAIGMTLAANIIPEWLVYKPDIPTPNPPTHTYGLHSRCTTLSSSTTCHPFPRFADCHASSTSKHFCSLWRTTGFLLSFVVVLQLASLIVFTICLAGGKQKRVQGWKLLCGIVGLSAVAKIAAVSFVGHMGSHEERFQDGWMVGRSWALAVAASAVEVGICVGLWGSRYFLEEEGGYELIPDRPMFGR